jgi:hypothetical protein|tara:strand:+ start:40 stop:468 length:429 start_codon:yes stop_codon:yes gene_type:complete
MPIPVALLAAAAKLGIRHVPKMLKEKGMEKGAKYLRKLIRKTEKQKTKQQETAEKRFTGQGAKRKQKKVIQRKKPKVDSGLSIKEKRGGKRTQTPERKEISQYRQKGKQVTTKLKQIKRKKAMKELRPIMRKGSQVYKKIKK